MLAKCYHYSGRTCVSPEYMRYRKRFYMYVYIYICMDVCLWGDHFSEKRVKFLTHKVMVVMRMRMRIRPH